MTKMKFFKKIWMKFPTECRISAIRIISIRCPCPSYTKQDYIIRKLLDKEVVVQGNPRVYKALRDQLATVLAELRRMEAGTAPDGDMLETIQLIANIMDGMKEGNAYGA